VGTDDAFEGTNAMKITVQKYRHINVGHEGGAMTCDLYTDGVLRAHVENQGTGGNNIYAWVYDKKDNPTPPSYRLMPADIAAHVAAQPPIDFYGTPMAPNLDILVEDACAEFDFAKKVAAAGKKAMVYSLPGDPPRSFRKMTMPYSVGLARNLRSAQPNAVIYNETKVA
jgi:hypothetical protein